MVTRRRRNNLLWCMVTAAALPISHSWADLAEVQTFSIAPQILSGALIQFSRQADVQVVGSALTLERLRTDGVSGQFTGREALQRLLASQPVTFEEVTARSVRILPEREAAGALGAGLMQELVLAQQSSTTAPDQSPAASAPRSASSGDDIGQIIVTATKREESAQDVPFSITALGEATLQRTGATGLNDYLAHVPGVHFDNGGSGRGNVVIRGVNTTGGGFFANQQSTTEIYVDEIPTLGRFAVRAFTDLNTFDVQRIEVLRGPQGSLFGSGSVGGAVRIITNKPDASTFASGFDTTLSSTQGGEAGYALNGMVNLPLISDQLAMRIVGYHREKGGWIDDSFRGRKDINGGTATGGRFMLGYTPTDNLSLRFTLTHQEDDYDSSDRVSVSRPDYAFPVPWDEHTRPELTSYNLTGEYDFGPAAFTSSTTYSDQRQDMSLGAGLLFSQLFGFDPATTDVEEWLLQDIFNFAQEFRLTSQSEGPLQWVVGAFYFRQSWRENQYWNITPGLGVALDSFIYIDLTERALFGEATYNFTDKVALTLGGRLFDNDFDLYRRAGGLLGVNVAPDEVTESKFAPKISFSFKPRDNINLYATATNGYRVAQRNFLSGTVDPVDGFVIPDGVGTDELWNYEVGIKSSLLDNRLRLNLATYFLDWKNIQLEAFSETYNYSANAGDAEIYGAELEWSMRPFSFLDIGGSYTYSRSELVYALPNTNYEVGARLPASPLHSSSTYLQLSTDSPPIGDAAYLRLDHSYQGVVLDNIINSLAMASDSHDVFNVRAGLYIKNFEAVLFVDNVSNNDAYTVRSSAGLIPPPDSHGFRLRPRTYGVTLRANF